MKDRLSKRQGGSSPVGHANESVQNLRQRVCGEPLGARAFGTRMTSNRLSIDPVTDKRFELVRRLGEGATGAVFLALDRETGEQVALKRLFKLDQKSVLRFKREFRSVADIHHPNLVKLYDLHRGEDAWFITMEYVAGNDFGQKFGGEASLATLQAANDNAPSELLRAFHDLARAIDVIHRAGMLHRDLKPSNALVADSGRVVVLDFGLVREIDGDVNVTQEGTVAGTPAYMAPEQAMGAKLSEASDWYAFGVMLYEAISGVLPIDDRNVTRLIQRKLSQDPQPLRSGAPTEVLDLCMSLLARDSDKRPSGTRVLSVLAAASGAEAEPITVQQHLTIEPGASATSQPLFGRDDDLERLKAALVSSAGGCSVVVHVRGTSGGGKSTLVEHFLDDAVASDLTLPVVLRSRCYEREAMPFKALDGVMDALVTHLARLDDVHCAHVLPVDVSFLCRLFPVLDRLSAVQQLRLRFRPSVEDTQTRARAEQALRTLVENVAREQRLILWIDDMQWGDLDSARVLSDWFDKPLNAPVLILLSYRSEEMQTSPCLELLLDETRDSVRNAHITIDLEPLQAAQIRTLCMHRLAQISMPPEPMIERIVEESQGNPFLAQQLTAVAEAKLARRDMSLDGLSMEALVQQASLYVEDSARALLSVLAIAGQPLSAQLALSTAKITSRGRAHIHSLRGLRLIRTRDVGGERLLEVYHDRVREAVQASLSAEQSQSIHAALLQELEPTLQQGDPDWLHTLALGAGQRASAFRHGWHAAEHASTSLAFERAAELYGKCILLFNGEMQLYVLWMKLAIAQAHCRRGHEAAKAYSSAAEHAPAAERSKLLQLAAAHLVRSGRFDDGERIVQQVLKTQKMHVPKSPAGLLAALAWEHGRLALRSYDVPMRQTEPRDSQRAEVAMLYGTLSAETQFYAPLRAAMFSARCLRMALDYGSPTQVARALCLAAVTACTSGTQRAARHSQDLLDRAEELFKRSGNREVQLELLCVRAVCAQFTGNVWAALEPANALDRLLETRSTAIPYGDYFYLFTIQTVRISTLQSLGRLLEARRLLSEHVARARATDNLAAVFQVTMNRVVDEQALNMCTGSRARLDAEYPLLPKGNFCISSMIHMLGVMRAACATRDFDWAFTRLSEFWQPFLRSVVHRSAFMRLLAHTLHSRLLINHHVETDGSGNIEALVRDDIKQLARLPPGLLNEIPVTRLRARLAYLQGEREMAIRELRWCVQRMADSDIRQEIEHDRYTLGLLVGGDEGRGLVASAREGLIGCGISDPDANMRAYVPELMR